MSYVPDDVPLSMDEAKKLLLEVMAERDVISKTLDQVFRAWPFALYARAMYLGGS